MNETTQTKIKPGQLYEILDDSRWAFFFDSSKISTFANCEQMFYYSYVKNIRLKGRSTAMDIGSWWSDVMSDFYEFMNARTLTKELALQSAAKHWAEHNLDQIAQTDPSGYKRFGGRDGAVVMIDRYFNSQADIDSRSWNIVATEAGFGLKREVLVAENQQVVVYYIGKPDLVVIDQGRLCPVDHKTVDRIDSNTKKKWKPRDQFPGYLVGLKELAKQLGMETLTSDRCIVNLAARQEPSDNPRDGKPKPRFDRAYPNYSQDEIDEWRRRKLSQAMRLRYSIENNEWLWNENACHLYAGCSYRRIDSTTPGSRELVIKTDYVQVEPWAPYEVED